MKSESVSYWITILCFDNEGFPLSRNPNDLYIFSQYLIFCREIINDSQKYVPEFLEDIIEKNLNCIQFITTPNNSLPLFNGANSNQLNQLEKYLEKNKPNVKQNILGGLYKMKDKNHFFIMDVEKPPQEFRNLINLDLYLLNIFRWN